MTDRAALTRQICLAPDGDTPRLIFADWCEDQGEADRAAFIRVQIERVQVYINRPKGIYSPYADTHSWKARFEDLRRRERELLDRHGFGWLTDFIRDARIPASAGVSLDRYTWQFRQVPNGIGWCEFRRGFVDLITCTAARWLSYGPAIVQQQPITRVVLSDREPIRFVEDEFSWCCLSGYKEPDYIPDQIFRLMYDDEGSGWIRSYSSVQAAKDALATAALLWARREAGLEVTA